MRDVDLWRVAMVQVDEPVAEVRRRIEDADIDIPLLVDEHGRPRGWLAERGMTGERVREELRSGPEPIVELDDVLRDALSDLLAHGSQYGPVVDDTGKAVGVLSMELLAHVTAGTGSSPAVDRARSEWGFAAELVRSASATPAALRAWSATASARTGSWTTSTATRSRCCSTSS